jgi:2-haloacid dehalogenase
MINTIIFDLGAVLIDWNPHYLYKKLFTEETQMLHFLQNICTPAWNEEQDGGRPLQEATDLLVNQYPEHAENIRHFYGRWEEMLGGAIEGSVEIFKELKDKNTYKFYALTNWSAETFPIAQQQFEFLKWFDGIVVSGTEKNRKPFASFYQLLLDRYNIVPQEALFIDDNLRNIQAAAQLGIQTVHFLSPAQLKESLTSKGIL